MNLEVLDIVAAAAIVFLAGTAQSAVGFGYALFSTPLLVWIGIPLPNAITLVATCSMLQAIMGSWRLHSEVPWRLSLAGTSLRVVCVLAGLFLLKKLAVLDPAQIRMALGWVLCLLVAVQMVWRPRPAPRMHWGWSVLAFSTSGLLAGFCGMGGPPLVLWSMAHDWSAKKTRGLLFSVFAVSIPVQLLLMIAAFGRSILWSAALGVAFLPLVALGTAVGLPIGNRLPRSVLRRIAYAILFVIGLSVAAPGLLARMTGS